MQIIAANAGLPRNLRTRFFNAVATATYEPFPPTSTDTRILMSDWSHFQGDVDIGKHLAYGPPKFKGVVIRSGQGRLTSYDDTRFIRNVQMCEANNFPWMLYHVLLPVQNAVDQANHLYEIVNRLGGAVPKWIWWDVEVHNNQTKKRVSDVTIDAIRLTEQLFGIGTGVYSARWFTSGYMETQDWFSEIVWWIAQWLHASEQKEHPWPTALPNNVGISQVMIHQTTSHADGRLVGVESERIDLDRWMWSIEKFNEIMGEEVTPPNDDLEYRIETNEKDIEKLKLQFEYLNAWVESYGDQE
jgi:GH25 family lysozyme M1 (1,4-beta-N-acetylmuramidase)